MKLVLAPRMAVTVSAKNEHLIVLPVEPLAKYNKFVNWPLHITIVPWFNCPSEDYPKLDKLLSDITNKHYKFCLEVGEIASFGWHGKEFLAQLIKPNNDLKQLHLDIFNTLETNGFPIHQKEYLGDAYKPHFIYKMESKYITGQKINVNYFSLIKQLRLKVTGTMIKELAKDYKLS